MKALLLATAVASFAFGTAANAAQWTFGNLIITQIGPENPTTFNNNPIGPPPAFPPGLENSSVCDAAYCGAIQWSSDGGVANTTNGSHAAPAGDSTNYLWGVNGINPLGFNGSEVIFNPAAGNPYPNSFNFYWGSIDALTTSDGTTRYDNTLSVHTLANTVDSVTGSAWWRLWSSELMGSAIRPTPTTINGSIYGTPPGRSSSSRPARRKTRSSSTWGACLSRPPGR